MASPTDILADASRRQQQLLEQLATAPLTEVLGVVSSTGVSGGRWGSEELWTLTLAFEAWRIPGDRLQTRPLTIRRKVTHQELASFQKLIKPYAVIRIRARVVADSPFGGPEALLEAFVGAGDSDSELSAVAQRLQQPVTYEDAVFGTFVLDRRVNWFEGKAVWNGKPVALHLAATEPAELEAALSSAHTLWQAQELWGRRIGDYAVERLLPLKNEDWLGEDEHELTADQFKAQMFLESVTVHPDGAFDFYHNDGDLFWGHTIEIRGSLSQGPTDADIAG